MDREAQKGVGREIHWLFFVPFGLRSEEERSASHSSNTSLTYKGFTPIFNIWLLSLYRLTEQLRTNNRLCLKGEGREGGTTEGISISLEECACTCTPMVTPVEARGRNWVGPLSLSPSFGATASR